MWVAFGVRRFADKILINYRLKHITDLGIKASTGQTGRSRYPTVHIAARDLERTSSLLLNSMVRW